MTVLPLRIRRAQHFAAIIATRERLRIDQSSQGH